MSRAEFLAKVEPYYSLIESRAKSQGLQAEREEGWGDETWLRVSYPNGRSDREQIYFDAPSAQALLAESFEVIHFLGDFEAVIDTTTGEIEARVNALDARGGKEYPWLIPGAEILDAGQKFSATPLNRHHRPSNWRMLVQHSDGAEIELSPGSQRMARILATSPEQFRLTDTLKIRGIGTKSNDAAVRVLEQYGGSFLLDLDLRYGRAIALTAIDSRSRFYARPMSAAKAAFPKNRYATQALNLYNYGRSAVGLPLLEFLAYYQATEFFFPSFARADTINRIQNVLRDPNFDLTNEITIVRLIAISEGSARGSSERDHLRTIVRACMEASEIQAFIESDKRYMDHFCSKSQIIKGVQRIQMQGAPTDLRDQVADRLYAIRCRVVHAKQDGGDAEVELLLPSSREARSLLPDVQLMRLIAQRVLIARAQPL